MEYINGLVLSHNIHLNPLTIGMDVTAQKFENKTNDRQLSALRVL